jgi:hypothetical protein
MKTTDKKDHYRKVFKSDHLGSADLEELIEDGKKLIFTIKEVRQEYGAKVAGKRVDANIAYFKENIKPMVLNATNSKQVAKFANSSWVQDWSDIKIELYIDHNVKFKGDTVDGVRIMPTQPKEKVKPIFSEDKFEAAFNASATMQQIKSKYIVDSATEKKYLDYVGAKE